MDEEAERHWRWRMKHDGTAIRRERESPRATTQSCNVWKEKGKTGKTNENR